MAERRATPRARLTISCQESEWERIREVAESRGVSINDHVISAGLNVELGPAQTDAPALALSEAEQHRLLDRVDRLAESMLSAASGGSIEAQFANRRFGLAIAALRHALGDGWSPSSMRWNHLR